MTRRAGAMQPARASSRRNEQTRRVMTRVANQVNARHASAVAGALAALASTRACSAAMAALMRLSSSFRSVDASGTCTASGTPCVVSFGASGTARRTVTPWPALKAKASFLHLLLATHQQVEGVRHQRGAREPRCRRWHARCFLHASTWKQARSLRKLPTPRCTLCVGF